MSHALRLVLQVGREAAAVAIVGAYVGAAAASTFGLTNLLPHLLLAGTAAGLVVGLAVALMGRQPQMLRALRTRLAQWGFMDVSKSVSSHVISAVREHGEGGRVRRAYGAGLTGLALYYASTHVAEALDWLGAPDEGEARSPAEAGVAPA